MFRFANPEYLHMLWLVGAVVLVNWYFQRLTNVRLKKRIGEKLIPLMVANTGSRRRKVKFFLQLLTWTMFILAAARPQMGSQATLVKSEGVELMLAIDVSTSMLAEDVKPSRLEHAKAEITRLLDLLGGDKVGLVAFAGSSILLSPLTTDKAALKMFLESLSPQSVERQGTDVAKALQEARDAFDRGGIDPDEGAKVTRVILVASDGEDHEQGALDLAKKFVKDGTRIFAMAFGTERGAPIPLRDERGFLVGYKRDKNGQNVMTEVKGTFLKSLAEAGQGGFYHSSFGGAEAKAIKADLDKLEKAEFDTQVSTAYDEKFQIFLVLGLLFAAIELFLGERRGQGRVWRGRFEVST